MYSSKNKYSVIFNYIYFCLAQLASEI